MLRNKAKDYGYQLLGKLMKEIGQMIKEKDLGYGLILKSSNMKATIKMVCNMEKEFGHHKKVKDMRGNGKNKKEMD